MGARSFNIETLIIELGVLDDTQFDEQTLLCIRWVFPRLRMLILHADFYSFFPDHDMDDEDFWQAYQNLKQRFQRVANQNQFRVNFVESHLFPQ